jgi:hypothetical protein
LFRKHVVESPGGILRPADVFGPAVLVAGIAVYRSGQETGYEAAAARGSDVEAVSRYVRHESRQPGQSCHGKDDTDADPNDWRWRLFDDLRRRPAANRAILARQGKVIDAEEATEALADSCPLEDGVSTPVGKVPGGLQSAPGRARRRFRAIAGRCE